MVLFNGVTVTVQVHGRPLEEYVDEDTGEADIKTVNRYIASKAGEPFVLKVDCSKTLFNEFSGFLCVYRVDGIQISRFYLLYGTDSIAGPEECVDGVWCIRQLHFTDLQISEYKAC